MKTALCFSGKLGKWELTKKSILEKIIKPFKPDIFLSTWKNENFKEFISFYKPKKIEILNFEDCKKDIFGKNCNQKLGLRPMCYGMSRSFSLISRKYKDYDLIIRLRPDLEIIDSLKRHEIKTNKYIKLPFYESHSIYNNEKELSKGMSFSFVFEKSILPNQINDQIALGPPQLMKQYMNCFNLIDHAVEFLKNNGYPSYMSEVPESVLTMCLKLNNIHYARLSGTSDFGNLKVKLTK
jgi:hypothetical protein